MGEHVLGGLRARVVGGDGAGEGAALTVVLLHGFGARGDDLLPLAHYLGLSANTRFVFPEAPVTLPGVFGDLRAWWPIDMVSLERAVAAGPLHEPAALAPERAAEARAQVSTFLDALEAEWDIPPERLVIGGFSQGAMAALDASLHDRRRCAALVLMSCTLLAEAEWRPLARAMSGVPVFQSHGRADALLGVEPARRLRTLLEEAGLEVEWCEFDGGHDIPTEVQRALGAFLRAILSSA